MAIGFYVMSKIINGTKLCKHLDIAKHAIDFAVTGFSCCNTYNSRYDLSPQGCFVIYH